MKILCSQSCLGNVVAPKKKQEAHCGSANSIIHSAKAAYYYTIRTHNTKNNIVPTPQESFRECKPPTKFASRLEIHVAPRGSFSLPKQRNDHTGRCRTMQNVYESVWTPCEAEWYREKTKRFVFQLGLFRFFHLGGLPQSDETYVSFVFLLSCVLVRFFYF